MSTVDQKELKSNYYIEYFKMIQRIIDRMARNSLLLKGWLVTIFAGIIVLKVSDYSSFISGGVIIITILFWFLDSYYLQQERLFRKLWRSKVEAFQNKFQNSLNVFDMNLNAFKKGKSTPTPSTQSSNPKPNGQDKVGRIPSIMLSVSEIAFYLPVIIINVVLFVYRLILP